MKNNILDGFYIVKPLEKLKWLGDKTIVEIINSKECPNDCVRIMFEEKEYSLNDIKIIKQIEL